MSGGGPWRGDQRLVITSRLTGVNATGILQVVEPRDGRLDHDCECSHFPCTSLQAGAQLRVQESRITIGGVPAEAL